MRPKKTEIMDTTLRDGEQMDKVSFSPVEKLTIAKKLLEIGIDRIEVASARAVKEDEDAVRMICSFAEKKGLLDRVEVLGFVDHKKSVNWIENCGGKTINLLAKGSKKHCEDQLNKNAEEHFEDIKKTIEYAQSRGMNVNVYLEDWSQGIINSEDYVFSIVEKLEKKCVKRVMLPDTLGILSPWQTEKYVKKMIEMFPEVHFDFHPHNDYDLGTANALAAIKTGIHGIQVTANTMGERAGNCSLYAVAAGSKDFFGKDLKLKEELFVELRKLVERASKIRVPPNEPIVGENTHKQTAGIHADGDKKGGLYMNKLKAERFGKSMRYSLGKQSGISSIEMNLKEIGMDLEKNDVKEITKKVREFGALGRSITKEDLHFIAGDVLKQPEKKPFEFTDIMIEIPLKGPKKSFIKVRLNNEEFQETAEGDGGYDSIMNALKKILKKENIKIPKLADYNPSIPPGGKTNALVETVIEWDDGKENFTTIGVDSDQTISAVKATEKMINLLMIRKKHN